MGGPYSRVNGTQVAIVGGFDSAHHARGRPFQLIKRDVRSHRRHPDKRDPVFQAGDRFAALRVLGLRFAGMTANVGAAQTSTSRPVSCPGRQASHQHEGRVTSAADRMRSGFLFIHYAIYGAGAPISRVKVIDVSPARMAS